MQGGQLNVEYAGQKMAFDHSAQEFASSWVAFYAGETLRKLPCGVRMLTVYCYTVPLQATLTVRVFERQKYACISC